MQLQRFRYAVTAFPRVLLLCSFWYMASFILMMDWRVRSYDPTCGTCHESCYYMACMVTVHGDFTIVAASTCWSNTCFYPVEVLLLGVDDMLGVPFCTGGRAVGVLWLAAFAAVLCLPCLSIIIYNAGSLSRVSVRLLLSFGVAGWYCGLILLYHVTRQEALDVVLAKSLALIGTSIALGACYWMARRDSYTAIVTVPIVIAIVSGTVWLVVSLPCTEPYM